MTQRAASAADATRLAVGSIAPSRSAGAAQAPVAAFEHRLKHDVSGAPEHRLENTQVCTMVVSVVDVFDALL